MMGAGRKRAARSAGRVSGRWLRTVGFSVVSVVAMSGLLSGQGLEQYDYDNLGPRGATGEIFIVFPSGVKETIGFGAKVDLGFLGPHVRVQGRGAYWTSELKTSEVLDFNQKLEDLVEEQNPGSEVSIDLGVIDRSALLFGGDLHWLPRVTGLVRPYLGVGVELYFLNGSGDAIEGTFVEEGLDLFTAGVSGVAGLEFGLDNDLVFYVDARGSLVSDVRSLAFAVGFGYIVEP